MWHFLILLTGFLLDCHCYASDQSKKIVQVHYPRVSPGAHPLTKNPEDSGYEIVCRLDWSAVLCARVPSRTPRLDHWSSKLYYLPIKSRLLAEYKIQLAEYKIQLRRVLRHGQTTRTSDPAVRWEEDVNRTPKTAGNRGYPFCCTPRNDRYDKDCSNLGRRSWYAVLELEMKLEMC